jgi:hypothetical protein
MTLTAAIMVRRKTCQYPFDIHSVVVSGLDYVV